MLNGTIEDAHARRDALSKIMARFQNEGKIINRYTLQEPLKQAGFDVSPGTVYRDITVINRENTWVKDLVESNYSAYQQRIAEALDWIESEAITQYQKEWTSDKTVNKQALTRDGDVIDLQEKTTTGEIASGKAIFLRILTTVQELRMKHTHGDNINISAALLTAELRAAKNKLKNQSEERTPIINVLELAKRTKKDENNIK